MSFLKKQWPLIVFGVVVLGSAGMGAWAIPAGSEVEKTMNEVAGIVRKLRTLQKNTANQETIEALKQQKKEEREEFDRLMATALAPQGTNAFYEDPGSPGTAPERETIIQDVLPEPEQAPKIAFKTSYNKEFEKLNERLRGGPAPTSDDVDLERARIQQQKGGDDDTTDQRHPWQSSPTKKQTEQDKTASENTLSDLLRGHAESRAAEKVAKNILVYVDDEPGMGFGKHRLAEDKNPPDAVQIWQAQFSLWIQQDIAAAIARCNEERVAELRKENRQDDIWVAHMPIKRLKVLRIDDVLGGEGGGSNLPRDWMESFTKVENNAKRFIVPLRLELIVEEAAIMDVLRHITSLGFYTILGVDYSAVTPDPICERYIYGDEPVVEAQIHLEGCYFREVFEKWIPKEIKQDLKVPGAASQEKPGGRHGR